MSVNIVTTQDGSPTLYSLKYKDHYHSTYGAIQESRHVFIEAGLRFCQQQLSHVSVLEVGLGTGLNVLLSVIYQEQTKIIYDVVEPEPVDTHLLKQLHFSQQLGGSDSEPLFRRIHTIPWEESGELSPTFQLTKFSQAIQDFTAPRKYDLIYFDAFSPTVQPELWTEEIFKSLYLMCKEQAVLVTYSSKGAVRRALAKAGFTVTKLPGPKGKREMVRACKMPKPLPNGTL